MESGVRLPQEHGSVASDGHRDISQVTYRELEWSDPRDVVGAAELLYLFCKMVNNEDLGELLDFVMPDGSKVQVIEAEARLYGYKMSGARVQLAFVGGIAAGLLIYSVVFESIVAIRCLYSEPWSQGLKLGKGLVDSLQPIPRILIFQTRKSAPPERLIHVTGARKQVIGENEHFITYKMEWRADDGIDRADKRESGDAST